MHPVDAIDDLRSRLRAAGVRLGGDFESGKGEDAATAWHVFKNAAKTAASDRFVAYEETMWVDPEYAATDLLLFESTEHDGTFYLSFTRQFTVDTLDGEYSGMYFLNLSVALEGPRPASVENAQIWGYAGPPRGAEFDAQRDDAGDVLGWTAAVEASPAFKTWGPTAARSFVVCDGKI